MTSPRRVGLLGGMFDPIHCGHVDVATAAEEALHLTGMLVLPSNMPPHRPQPVASGHHRFAMAAMAVAGRRGWRAVDLELRQDVASYTSDTLRRFHASGFEPAELVFITGADAFLEIATWHDYPAVLDLAHFAVVSRPRVSVGGLPAQLPALAARMRRVSVVSPTFPDAKARRPGLPGVFEGGATQSAPGSPTRHPRWGGGTMHRRPNANERRRRGTNDVRLTASARATADETCIFLIDALTADVSSTAIRRARQARQSIAGWVPVAVQHHIEQHGLYEDPTPAADTPEGSLASAAGRLHGQD